MSTDHKYPFVTKAEIKRRLADEPAFVLECLALMQSRHELRCSGAATSGPFGWMSSQRAKATALAKRATSGEISPKELAEAARLLSGYAKQIASVFRENALAADPSLADTARVFGVLPSSPSSLAGHRTARSPKRTEPAPVCEPRETTHIDPKAARAAAEQSHAESDEDGEPDGGGRDDELELRDLVLSHVASNPSVRSEEIAKALGVTTAMVSPVLRELVHAGRLRSLGAGRGTRYATS